MESIQNPMQIFLLLSIALLPNLLPPIRLGCSPTDFLKLFNSTPWFWVEVSRLPACEDGESTPKYCGPEVQKTQRQIRKHNSKSENTTANQKTRQQIRKHNSESENLRFESLMLLCFALLTKRVVSSSQFWESIRKIHRIKTTFFWMISF